MRGKTRRVAAMIAVAALLGGVVSVRGADAAEDTVTVAGDVVCAKCTLEVEGLDHCQNVLLVGDGAQQKRYWLVANEVNATFGDVCAARRPVTITGTTNTKDGKHWLTPAKIEPRDGQ
ncbi:MAG: hypothetical protein IT294_19060 [Deltaproteobacteria bacterium]|nr:hypothetical protein [Deltaproteobacteria bacterium]